MPNFFFVSVARKLQANLRSTLRLMEDLVGCHLREMASFHILGHNAYIIIVIVSCVKLFRGPVRPEWGESEIQ